MTILSKESRTFSPLEAFHYAALKDGVWSHTPFSSGIRFWHSDATDSAPWNHACADALAEADVRAWSQRLLETAQALQRRPVFYLTETQRSSAAWQSLLAEQAAAVVDREAWLWVDPATSVEQASNPEIHLVEVKDARTRSEFAEGFSQGFGMPARLLGALISEVAGAFSVRHFLFQDAHGTRVGIGSLLMDRSTGISELANVATLPSERGRGVGAATTRALLEVAKQEGMHTVFLQATADGVAERMYLRAGFKRIELRTGFELPVSVSPTPSATRTYWPSLLAGIDAPAGIDIPPRLFPGSAAGPEVVSLSAVPGARYDDWLVAALILQARYLGESGVGLACRSSLSGTNGAGVRLGELQFLPMVCSITNQSAVSYVYAQLERQRSLASDQSVIPLVDVEQELGGRLPLSFLVDGSPAPVSTALFPWQLKLVANSADSLSPTLHVDTRKICGDLAQQVGEHLAHLVQQLVAQPNEREDLLVGELGLLSLEARETVLAQWSRSESSVADVKPFLSNWAEMVRQQPDHVALRFDGRAWSYLELEQLSDRWADLLRRQGAGPEALIALCLPSCLELVVGMLAILKTGAAFLPIDPNYPPNRKQYLLNDAQCTRVIVDDNSGIDDPRALPVAELAAHELTCADAVPASEGLNDDDRLAYVIYTSGTTGDPKGVEITHRAMAHHHAAVIADYGLLTEDRILQFSSPGFDIALEEILPTLALGATLVLCPPEARTTLNAFQQLVEREKVSVLNLPTAFWHQWVQVLRTDTIPSVLRLMIIGGEQASAERVADWHRLVGAQIPLVNAYGPTEVTVTSMVYHCPPNEETDLTPIGVPLGKLRAYVLDASMHLVPAGVTGELYLGGVGVARGYRGQAELTEQKFVADPFRAEVGARLYRTGDCVRFRSDGQVEFAGRSDRQVKIRGFRIELGEIETQLLRLDDVASGVVAVREEGAVAELLAWVTLSAGARKDAVGLRDALAAKMPAYMVPQRMFIVDALPTNTHGKIDVDALVQRAAAIPCEAAAASAPIDAQEQLMLEQFREVLGNDALLVTDHFFDCGGDSLLLMRLINALEAKRHRPIAPQMLYEHGTPRCLAQALKAEEEIKSDSPLVTLRETGDRVPVYFFHTSDGDVLGYVNLVNRLGPDYPCYGLQARGWQAPSLAHESIWEMAAYYRRAIRAQNPEGPYVLAGWCYGGLVAVETARQLRNEGAAVESVLLFETWPTLPKGWAPRYYLERALGFLRLKPNAWLDYARTILKYHRYNLRRLREYRVPPNLLSSKAPLRGEQLAYLDVVNSRAYRRHRTRYYPGRIDQFRIYDRDPHDLPIDGYGWKSRCDALNVYHFDALHDDFLREPNVDVVAARVRQCIDEITTASASGNLPGSESPQS